MGNEVVLPQVCYAELAFLSFNTFEIRKKIYRVYKSVWKSPAPCSHFSPEDRVHERQEIHDGLFVVTCFLVIRGSDVFVHSRAEVLQKGGNAADAAVAAAAALQVLQPYDTGVGGDCFCLFYEASTKSVRCVDGR